MSAWEAAKTFAGSSVASVIAETATLPTDVAKTRLQVDSAGIYRGSFLYCLKKTATDDGVGALWKGLAPALVRQVCYSSLAMVLFAPIRDSLVPEVSPPPRPSRSSLVSAQSGL